MMNNLGLPCCSLPNALEVVLESKMQVSKCRETTALVLWQIKIPNWMKYKWKHCFYQRLLILECKDEQ
jgi:hypothetical protein